MTESALYNWTPIHVAPHSNGARVDWCRLGEMRFTEPFFEQTITSALRNPARMLFRRQTSFEDLEKMGDNFSGLSPRGFIFHLSRCGSTLIAQLLAALPQNLVISEPPPLDQTLSVLRDDSRISHAQRIARLRGMVNALGQQRHRDERNFFIKFDSWHVLELSLIQEAFPDVPWIFLYRDPVEVMVSQHRQRGTQMIPGLCDPRLFNIEPATLPQMSLDEYCARVLAQICVAAAMHVSLGNGRLVNFTELPGAVWNSLGDFFGVAWTTEDVARMQKASLANAKMPVLPHIEDSATKQNEASGEIRRLAATWLSEPYARLETLRLAQAEADCDTAERAESASSRSRSQSLTTQSITR